jgi:hypothetical protein
MQTDCKCDVIFDVFRIVIRLISCVCYYSIACGLIMCGTTLHTEFKQSRIQIVGAGRESMENRPGSDINVIQV